MADDSVDPKPQNADAGSGQPSQDIESGSPPKEQSIHRAEMQDTSSDSGERDVQPPSDAQNLGALTQDDIDTLQSQIGGEDGGESDQLPEESTSDASAEDVLSKDVVDDLLAQATDESGQSAELSNEGINTQPSVGGEPPSLAAAGMESAIESEAAEAGNAAPPLTQPVQLPDFSDGDDDAAERDISMLRDVDLKVHIELGHTMMYIEDVLKLTEGSVVELDSLAGDPVDVYVNGRLVARGEVLVLSDNFCVRVSEIVSGPQHVSMA